MELTRGMPRRAKTLPPVYIWDVPSEGVARYGEQYQYNGMRAFMVLGYSDSSTMSIASSLCLSDFLRAAHCNAFRDSTAHRTALRVKEAVRCASIYLRVLGLACSDNIAHGGLGLCYPPSAFSEWCMSEMTIARSSHEQYTAVVSVSLVAA
jgi:hypothetical protein